MSRFSRWLAPTTVVRAHCDLPCGVYDPEQARIEAESVFRIQEKYQGNEDAVYRARAIHIEEERADLVKEHLDVLWHDYFKPEHLEAVPNLHELFWNATKAASKAKASVDPADGKALLAAIDKIDAAWKKTGGAGEDARRRAPRLRRDRPLRTSRRSCERGVRTHARRRGFVDSEDRGRSKWPRARCFRRSPRATGSSSTRRPADWPRRGSVVVVREPDSGDMAIKRVAAGPGDRVRSRTVT